MVPLLQWLCDSVSLESFETLISFVVHSQRENFVCANQKGNSGHTLNSIIALFIFRSISTDGCYFPIWSETISDNLKSKPTWVTPQAGPMIEHLQKSVISVIEDWQHGARRQISCRAQGLTSKKLLSPGSDQRELVAYNSQGLSGHAAVRDQGHIGQQPHL